MSRCDRVYVNDRIERCEMIAACIDGLDRQTIEKDWIRYEALLRCLEVLGEAAKGVSDELRQRRPQIPWRKVAGLRDIVIHRYFGLDTDAIWDAANHRAPELLNELRRISDEEFPEG